MEILENFGFNIQLFVAQIVNFLILAYLFKRFLYKPILNLIKQREDKIKQGLEDAEKANQLLETTKKERDQLLKETRQEADKILNNTKFMANEIKEKTLNDAKGDARKIVEDAKKQAQVEMENIEKRAKVLTIELSQKILDKVIKDLFTKEEKEKILERSLKNIPKYE